jgi:lipopolysaccharide export LptBFGC system permease protein LptF
MDQMLDFSDWAFVFSLVVAALAVPLYWLARPGKPMAPLLGFIIVMLAFGGAVGALGRLVDSDAVLDYWIRIAIIATRLAVVGAMLYDIRWLWKRRT